MFCLLCLLVLGMKWVFKDQASQLFVSIIEVVGGGSETKILYIFSVTKYPDDIARL